MRKSLERCFHLEVYRCKENIFCINCGECIPFSLLEIQFRERKLRELKEEESYIPPNYYL